MNPKDNRPIDSLVDAYFHCFGRPRRCSKLLVAVSGGPDSVALLEVLGELADAHRWTLGVAHINHGLRGAESDADARFVRQLARSHNYRFHLTRLNSESKAASENLQAWARESRYRFLERTARQGGYDYIAIAHQLNDRAETVAAAVLGGGGTFALSGIPPVRGNVIRPFFDVPRDQILSYLTERHVTYRVDSSNDSDHYQRNRIRQQILPGWENENPGIVAGLARMGKQLWLQRRYLEDQARRIVTRATKSVSTQTLTLDARRLLRYDVALDPFVLRELAEKVQFHDPIHRATVSRFTNLRVDRRATGSVEQGNLVIAFSKGITRVASLTQPPVEAEHAPTRIETRVIAMTTKRCADDRQIARFDLDAIAGKLTVRNPQVGDRYQPIGLAGTKKLSDLLADRGVPSFERPLVTVVADDLGILWPVGHPIAHRARLTTRTRRVLEARLLEGSWTKRS